ncbi:hypothetical protein [Streptomyces phaeofaciens]|nr:hypothetical protein [Streptomyces phaeofaciens]
MSGFHHDVLVIGAEFGGRGSAPPDRQIVDNPSRMTGGYRSRQPG